MAVKFFVEGGKPIHRAVKDSGIHYSALQKRQK